MKPLLLQLLVEKKCTNCGGLGPFYKNKSRSDGLSGECRACLRVRYDEWRSANPEKAKAATNRWRARNSDRNKASKVKWRAENLERVRSTARRSTLVRMYGITVEDFSAMFKQQHGICPVCGSSMKEFGRGSNFACVDHDHTTGKIRGLLHQKCNVGLGHFNDDPVLLRKAANYLEGK